jgi:hypothetical protein
MLYNAWKDYQRELVLQYFGEGSNPWMAKGIQKFKRANTIKAAARKMGTTAFLLAKAIRTGDPAQRQPGQPPVKWGAGRAAYKFSRASIQWAVSLEVLQYQVGCSLSAKCLDFNNHWPNEEERMQPWLLRRIYRQHDIKRRFMSTRVGKPILPPRDVQQGQINDAREGVRAARLRGDVIVQVDEACFTPKAMDRRHWLPKGGVKVPTRFPDAKQIKYVAAICEETGLLCTDWSEKAFKGRDMVRLLGNIRKIFDNGEGVTVFWDGASIHKAVIVREAARRLNITCVLNAPYRPDLNGIELLWRRAKIKYYQKVDARKVSGECRWNNYLLARDCVESATARMCISFAKLGWKALEAAEPVDELVYFHEREELRMLTSNDPGTRPRVLAPNFRTAVRAQRRLERGLRPLPFGRDRRIYQD